MSKDTRPPHFYCEKILTLEVVSDDSFNSLGGCDHLVVQIFRINLLFKTRSPTASRCVQGGPKK